ncbi:MAG TPA: choice-of-anchor A family protein [Marmoricola sp.]
MSMSMLSRARRAVHLPYVAALAAGVLTLGGLQALAVDRADATTPACTPTSNAFGPATGWTEFIEGNGSRGADTEGAIAYGGNLPTAIPVGSRLSGYPQDKAALVVAGSHGQYFALQYGSAYVTPQSGVNFNGGGHYLTTNPINFTSAFAALRTLSSDWGAAAATGTISTGTAGGNQALVFTGSSTELNVFTLTEAQKTALADPSIHLALNVPNDSTIIVNVPGSTATVRGQMWRGTGSSAQQVDDSMTKADYNGLVWNFPDATSVTINFGSAFGGHILAPNAAVEVPAVGHIIGQVIAKSFSSNYQTHLNLFPSQACVPGPPVTPGDSDVTITKSASTASPAGGSTFTYTLTAKNVGDATATGVQIRDALPSGVTFVSATAPCAQSGGIVTCNVSDLAPNASATVTITVTANPIAGAGPVTHPGGDHWMTPYHPEMQVDLEPGQQRSVSLSCNDGDILSDGNFRVDHVDQGTGVFSDVKVLSSRSTSTTTWSGTIRNDATGRVQAKAFIVCLPGSTEGGNDGHRHNLLVDPAPVTQTQSLAVGRTGVTLTCRPGTVPVAPGYDLSSAGARLVGSETSYAARTWTLTFETPSLATVTASVLCLSTTTSAVGGHTHQLNFTHVVRTVSVPSFTDAQGTEFKVTCPDDAKGVVATFDLPPGVSTWGNDPRLKERAFRLFNPGSTAKDAVLDLVCLHDRVGTDMGTSDPVSVVNTASVSSVSFDANETNNSASATVTVVPGSSTAAVAGRMLVGASASSLRVLSSMPGTAALSVRSKGALLARGTVGLRPGSAVTAKLTLTRAGKRQLAKLDRVTVSVDPTRGKTVRQSVAVQR